MVSSNQLQDYLKVDDKSLGDFLTLFGMEREDLPMIGITEIDIPAFGVNSIVYFLVYDDNGKMGYKGFRPEDAQRELVRYDHMHYYEGDINTKLTTGFLLKIGDMIYRPLNGEERSEIEKILESS
jgi:hypothetical protein